MWRTQAYHKVGSKPREWLSAVMKVSGGFKYFLWAWRNLVSRHKRPARKKKPLRSNSSALTDLRTDEARSALTSSSDARGGSNCDFTLPVTPYSSNALRPPRKSDPEPVQLWRVCGVREPGGARCTPAALKLSSLLPLQSPQPSITSDTAAAPGFARERGKGSIDEGRAHPGTGPPLREEAPRSLCHRRPAVPGRNPAPAAQPTSPLRARLRLLWPAQLSAAPPGSARLGTCPLTRPALHGAARLPAASATAASRRFRPRPPRLLHLLLLWNLKLCLTKKRGLCLERTLKIT